VVRGSIGTPGRAAPGVEPHEMRGAGESRGGGASVPSSISTQRFRAFSQERASGQGIDGARHYGIGS